MTSKLITAHAHADLRPGRRAKRTTLTVTLSAAVLLLAAGCEPVDEATPGVYGGKTDQLMSSDTASRAEALAKRFQLVQADR